MSEFSLGRAFSETFAFFRNNWLSMLLWMGGAVLGLAIVFSVMVGGNFALLASGTAGSAAGPDNVSAVFAMIGQIFLFGLFAMVVVYGAGMMIWRMGLSREASTGDVGWALLAGLTYAFAMFVVMLAAYIALILVFIVVMLVFGVAGGGMGAFTDPASMSMGGGTIAAMIALYLAMIVAVMWLQGRLLAAGPIMADRKMTNPFAAIAQSWRMSASAQWRILGFLVVFAIVSYAIFFVLGMVGAVVVTALAGESARTGIAAMIVLAIVVYLPFLLLWMSIPPGIYRALGGIDDSAEVFA